MEPPGPSTHPGVTGHTALALDDTTRFRLSQLAADQFDCILVGNVLHRIWDVRPFVLARRLVEAGVRVVTLRVGSWDHHSAPEGDIFHALRHLLPVLDRSLYALFNDLRARGLDRDVLVVVLGEFGRTPKISQPGPGREHWADAGCALFAGGGMTMGQVIGETDSRAERSTSGQISFENIMATLYTHLGVDVSVKLPDFNGRPQHLLNDRTSIRELLG